ncbi:MAG: hypothetical protein JNJ85_04265 [Candidatus Kapabacteria bacterium]|nr:hypothetical protein [Candidatus Kapabacteria bacterium]
MTVSDSTNIFDYEILIRRYDMSNQYASYCPQLARMIKGEAHEEVENAMKDVIMQHINALKEQQPKSDA